MTKHNFVSPNFAHCFRAVKFILWLHCIAVFIHLCQYRCHSIRHQTHSECDCFLKKNTRRINGRSNTDQNQERVTATARKNGRKRERASERNWWLAIETGNWSWCTSNIISSGIWCTLNAPRNFVYLPIPFHFSLSLFSLFHFAMHYCCLRGFRSNRREWKLNHKVTFLQKITKNKWTRFGKKRLALTIYSQGFICIDIFSLISYKDFFLSVNLPFESIVRYLFVLILHFKTFDNSIFRFHSWRFICALLFFFMVFGFVFV